MQKDSCREYPWSCLCKQICRATETGNHQNIGAVHSRGYVVRSRCFGHDYKGMSAFCNLWFLFRDRFRSKGNIWFTDGAEMNGVCKPNVYMDLKKRLIRWSFVTFRLHWRARKGDLCYIWFRLPDQTKLERNLLFTYATIMMKRCLSCGRGAVTHTPKPSAK